MPFVFSGPFFSRTALARILGGAVALCLAGCMPQSDASNVPTVGSQTTPEVNNGVDSTSITSQEDECRARGGSFQASGMARIMECIEEPSDAGLLCTASSQCESSCLSASKTCAPIKPLYGCHDILDNSGREVTLCRD